MTLSNFQQVGKINLVDSDQIAKGSLRLVFRHPEHSGLLVKVVDPEAIKIRYGKNVAWYKLPRRMAHYACFYREMTEFIAVWSKDGHTPHFLQRIVGFVDTQFGLGMVVEAAMNEAGEYAPSLASLAREGQLNHTVIEQLNHFWKQLLSSNVVVSDLHPGNLVQAYDPLNGPHLTLIDGIGCSTIIPLEAKIPSINRRTKKRKFKRLLLGLHMISSQRQDTEAVELLAKIRV